MVTTPEAVKEPEIVAPEKPEKKKSTSKAIVKRGTDAVGVAERGAPTMEEVLMRAVDKDASIETIERLSALYEKAQAKANEREFYDAFAAFQTACPVIKKTRAVKSEGGNVLYHYAPLDQIVKQLAGHIGKHGLHYRFETHDEAATEQYPRGRISVTCIVSHRSGHVERASSPWIAVKEANRFTNDAQQSGTALMYAKRNAFCSAFGIATEDDDTDGGGRISPQQARQAPREVRQPRPTPTAQRAAEAQKKELAQIEPAAEGEESIDQKTGDDLAKAMKHATLGLSDLQKRFPKIERLGQIKKADLGKVLSWIADPVRN